MPAGLPIAPGEQRDKQVTGSAGIVSLCIELIDTLIEYYGMDRVGGRTPFADFPKCLEGF